MMHVKSSFAEQYHSGTQTEFFEAAKMMSAQRTNILIGCVFATILIAVCDWSVGPDASLGLFYIVPLITAAAVLSRKQILLCSVLAAFLRRPFSPDAMASDSLLRFFTGLIGFASSALIVEGIARRRRFEMNSATELRKASELRLAAEQDAKVVIETSPAAILTVNEKGQIDLANGAARRLLGLNSDTGPRQHIREYFPMLASMLERGATPTVRAMVEAQGRRANGDMFFAHLWLSTYSTPAGLKLAAVIADVSEQIREREELGLRQLLLNSHIIAGAVSHEIRNLAAAAAALYNNLALCEGISGTEDFQALGTLIRGMQKLSSAELPSETEAFVTGVDLNALLKELDIILRTSTEDSDIELRWDVASDLPRVRAHHAGLLQVFLNLTQNSRRAVRGRRNPCITIVAHFISGSVSVMVVDNGPGVASPEMLFQPFQPGAASTGLGLYVSRAIVRTYGGELRYVSRSLESCFILELPAVAVMEAVAIA